MQQTGEWLTAPDFANDATGASGARATICTARVFPKQPTACAPTLIKSGMATQLDLRCRLLDLTNKLSRPSSVGRHRFTNRGGG